MKILFIHNSQRTFLQLRGDLVDDALERGHEVEIALPHSPADLELVDKFRKRGLPLHLFSLSRTGLNPLRDLRTVSEIKKLLLRVRADHVFATTIKPVIYAGFAAHPKMRLSAMITGLGSSFSRETGLRTQVLNRFSIQLYRRAIQKYEHLFFQNEEDCHLFRKNKILRPSQSHSLVPGSGVHLQKFHPTPFPKAITFLFVARLLKEKGIHEFVAAARLLKAKYPSVEFHIVGSIDENPSGLSSQDLAALTADEIVHYHGETQNIFPYLAAASVFVLPSFYREGLSKSILEALASGRPVITTHLPGLRESIQSDPPNGLLVAPKDERALAEAMEFYIQNPHRIVEMGKVSRQVAESRFDSRKVNAQILDTLERGSGSAILANSI